MDKIEYTIESSENRVDEVDIDDHKGLIGIGMDDSSEGASDPIHIDEEDVKFFDTKTLYKVVHIPPENETVLVHNNISADNTGITPCQFYVLSNNPQSDFATTPHRNISPRPQSAVVHSQQQQQRTTTNPVGKKRDDRRRATHNEVERRRRDKINNWIMKLSKLLPEAGKDMGTTSNGHFEGLSKGGILAKAYEYISELKETNTSLSECLKENEKVGIQNIKLMETNERLRRDNELLRAQIAQHGIAPAPDTIES